MPHLNPDWFYLPGTGFPRLFCKRGRQTDAVGLVAVVSLPDKRSIYAYLVITLAASTAVIVKHRRGVCLSVAMVQEEVTSSPMWPVYVLALLPTQLVYCKFSDSPQPRLVWGRDDWEWIFTFPFPPILSLHSFPFPTLSLISISHSHWFPLEYSHSQGLF